MDEVFIDLTDAVAHRMIHPNQAAAASEGQKESTRTRTSTSGITTTMAGYEYPATQPTVATIPAITASTTDEERCRIRLAVGSTIVAELRAALLQEQQLTVSAGVSVNKLLAKLVASEHKQVHVCGRQQVDERVNASRVFAACFHLIADPPPTPPPRTVCLHTPHTPLPTHRPALQTTIVPTAVNLARLIPRTRRLREIPNFGRNTVKNLAQAGVGVTVGDFLDASAGVAVAAAAGSGSSTVGVGAAAATASVGAGTLMRAGIDDSTAQHYRQLCLGRCSAAVVQSKPAQTVSVEDSFWPDLLHHTPAVHGTSKHITHILHYEVVRPLEEACVRNNGIPLVVIVLSPSIFPF
jgi:hypothetical protein